MGLITCHECGKEVSNQAKNCPHCGAKVKKPASSTAKIIVVLIGVIFFSAIITGQQQDEKSTAAKANTSPEQKAAEAKRDAQLQFAAMGAVDIKKSMKDPEAFELTSLYVTLSGYSCYEYRAKNSFGAVLPAKAVVTPDGKMLFEERQARAFQKAWNKECTQAGGDEIAALTNRLMLK